jgi:hypothetical protein
MKRFASREPTPQQALRLLKDQSDGAFGFANRFFYDFFHPEHTIGQDVHLQLTQSQMNKLMLWYCKWQDIPVRPSQCSGRDTLDVRQFA